MPETNGHNSLDRLDRVEGIIEARANRQNLIEDEFVRLLRAQVVVGGTMNKMGDTLNKLGEAQKELAESQKRTDESMHALILTVDEIIRGRKRE